MSPRIRVPMFGRTYRYRYGYPWRWAILAEAAWRVEHLLWSFDGQLFGPLSRWGYAQRKRFERKGSKLT